MFCKFLFAIVRCEGGFRPILSVYDDRNPKGSLAYAHAINDEIRARPPSKSKYTALDDIRDIIERERFGPEGPHGWFERR